MSRVTERAAADPSAARTYFEGLMAYETDCWDVHASLGDAQGFVLLDVRAPQSFDEGHVPGAVSLPHAKINERNLGAYPADTLFVVYCNGPHCNGADRAAAHLARLGRPVKKMIGGIDGWKDEGFPVLCGDAMTIERLLAFGDAWNRGDVDEIMSYFAVECTYYASVGPEPGRTYEGREAVRRGVIDILAHDRGGKPQSGAALVADRRGVAEWSYEFTAADSAVTTIRGCDVFEFEGDLIRRKDAFRKVYA